VDDTKLIREIHKGNTSLLEQVAEKYYDDIYRFCCYQTGSREDAYDCAQETFIRFIRYADSYRDNNLKGYLLTIARNVCRDYFKCAAREQEFINGQMDQVAEEKGVSWTEEPYYHDTLLKALGLLPALQREALILYYYDELKIREIARITETNAATVKSRLHQGKIKLKKLLEEA
jgi:RNA polymerase sigma factor (sigma-70 family)